MASNSSDDTQPAMTYPNEDQYDQWKNHAEEMDMSISEFMKNMVEAGRKKFDGSGIEPDESAADLREQRNDLRSELDHARQRIKRLEKQLHQGEQRAIKEFVAENPGSEYREIVESVQQTVPERVRSHLETMEGADLDRQEGVYYAAAGEEVDQ